MQRDRPCTRIFSSPLNGKPKFGAAQRDGTAAAACLRAFAQPAAARRAFAQPAAARLCIRPRGCEQAACIRRASAVHPESGCKRGAGSGFRIRRCACIRIPDAKAAPDPGCRHRIPGQRFQPTAKTRRALKKHPRFCSYSPFQKRKMQLAQNKATNPSAALRQKAQGPCCDGDDGRTATAAPPPRNPASAPATRPTQPPASSRSRKATHQGRREGERERFRCLGLPRGGPAGTPTGTRERERKSDGKGEEMQGRTHFLSLSLSHAQTNKDSTDAKTDTAHRGSRGPPRRTHKERNTHTRSQKHAHAHAHAHAQPETTHAHIPRHAERRRERETHTHSTRSTRDGWVGRTAGRRKNRCATRAVNAPAGWRDNNTNMHTHLRLAAAPTDAHAFCTEAASPGARCGQQRT